MRETVSVLVSLPPDVHRAGRTAAVARNMSFSRFVTSLIRRELGLPSPANDLQKAAPKAARTAFSEADLKKCIANVLETVFEEHVKKALKDES